MLPSRAQPRPGSELTFAGYGLLTWHRQNSAARKVLRVQVIMTIPLTRQPVDLNNTMSACLPSSDM